MSSSQPLVDQVVLPSSGSQEVLLHIKCVRSEQTNLSDLVRQSIEFVHCNTLKDEKPLPTELEGDASILHGIIMGLLEQYGKDKNMMKKRGDERLKESPFYAISMLKEIHANGLRGRVTRGDELKGQLIERSMRLLFGGNLPSEMYIFIMSVLTVQSFEGLRFLVDALAQFCAAAFVAQELHTAPREGCSPEDEDEQDENHGDCDSDDEHPSTVPQNSQVVECEEIRHQEKTRNKRCEQDGCTKWPIFNFRQNQRGRFCGKHKLDGMIDVLNKRCEQEGCSKQPFFNNWGEPRGLYCGEHRLPGMVDVQHKRCAQQGCLKHPSFNFPDEKRGRFCGQHKQDKMVNVRPRKKCRVEDCKKVPLFNVDGKKQAVLCSDHRKEGMVNVAGKDQNEVGVRDNPTTSSQQPSKNNIV